MQRMQKEGHSTARQNSFGRQPRSISDRAPNSLRVVRNTEKRDFPKSLTFTEPVRRGMLVKRIHCIMKASFDPPTSS